MYAFERTHDTLMQQFRTEQGVVRVSLDGCKEVNGRINIDIHLSPHQACNICA